MTRMPSTTTDVTILLQVFFFFIVSLLALHLRFPIFSVQALLYHPIIHYFFYGHMVLSVLPGIDKILIGV